MAVQTIWTSVALSFPLHLKANGGTPCVRVYFWTWLVCLAFIAFSFTFEAFITFSFQTCGFKLFFSLFQLFFQLGFLLAFVWGTLRTCSLNFLPSGSRGLEGSLSCLDALKFTQDFMAFFPSFRDANRRSACSVRSRPPVQTYAFCVIRSNLLDVGDKLFSGRYGKSYFHHIGVSSLPCGFELNRVHILSFREIHPLGSYPKLSFNSGLQELEESCFDHFVRLGMPAFFFQSGFHLLHDIVVYQQARA